MSGSTPRATVLVVDDTPQNLELLDECLSPHYRVKVATSGERALALCAAEAPDLILLDVMMPDMDGFEVLRRLKADAATCAVPVIFATAKGDKADEHIGLQLGAADYVTKPIHIPVLLARVKTHLALYEYRRNLEGLVRQRTAELSEALKRVEKDERKLQVNMSRLAFARNHDELTSLCNRSFLMQRLGELMREALLDGGTVAVAAINLDRFRTVNQALGVAAGDELLMLVAKRLSGLLGADELLARAGGDEFVLVSSLRRGRETSDQEAIVRHMLATLNRLLAALREPLLGQTGAVELTASAGLAVFPFDGESPSELLRNAGVAASAAKREGRNRALAFKSEWAGGDALRFEQEAKLRRAISEHRITPYYQPKVHATSGALVGAEALIRWPRNEGGFHSPGEFLPLAESAGLMEALDDLVIVSVLRQIAEWGPRLPEGFRVAVNISSHRFHDGKLPAQMRDWLNQTGATAKQLELEITEGALIGDTRSCAQQLQQLRTLGIELTLDDFGTGYSSLSYLKQLPLQHLKVDQSFVRDIERDANDAAIVRAIIALAKALNLHTVTEGIETLSQLKFVQELGCQTVQGFLFSPAVSAEAFSKLIDAGRVEMQAAG
ncbi:MAG: EAL domain-containing protein [Pseudomonadota bacterium]